MKVWDRWTVRRNKYTKDHFYEWHNANYFVYICTEKRVEYPAWFRSSDDNETFPNQFLKAYGEQKDKVAMKNYPKLDMCKQCRAIQVMGELSD